MNGISLVMSGAALAFGFAAFWLSLKRRDGGKRTTWLPEPRARRRVWPVVVAAGLVPLIGVPLIWRHVPARYEAMAVVGFLPGPMGDSGSDTAKLYEYHINTQAGLLRSRGVLERTLDKRNVRSTAWYKAATANPLDSLLRDLTVRPRPQTFYIDVCMRTRRPDEAKLIVDAVVDAYLQLNAESRNDQRVRVLDLLRQERDALDLAIRGKTQQMHQTAKPVGTIDVSALRSDTAVRLASLEWKRDELKRVAADSTDGDRASPPVRAEAAAQSVATRPAAGGDAEALRNRQQEELDRLDADVEKMRRRIAELSSVSMQLANYEQEICHLKDLHKEYQRRIETLQEEMGPRVQVRVVQYGLLTRMPAMQQPRYWLSGLMLTVPLLAMLCAVVIRSLSYTRSRPEASGSEPSVE